MADFDAQWRASAHEAVPYTEDFPECLLILPELTDGAIAQGKAERIAIHITLNEQKGVLIVSDNGKGITDFNRLSSWASKDSRDVHHRYGHGSKKCLTKWHKDYDTAKWSVTYRTKDKRQNPGSLFTYNAPFVGNKKLPEEDEKDETVLWPSGTKWEIEFDRSILGDFNTKDKLFDAIKEILRTRYVKDYFDKTEFILTINDGTDRTESSRDAKYNWKTFEECLQEEVDSGRAMIAYKDTIPFNNGIMYYAQYRLSVRGNTSYNLKDQFPRYGTKNQKYARLHISISGRIIEIPHIHEFYKGRTSTHNDFNGFIGIVKFIPNNPDDYGEMPTPCTTKVSFYQNCPNYKKFIEMIYDIHETMQKKKGELLSEEKSEIKVQPVQQVQPVQPEEQEQQEQQEQEELESEQKQDYIMIPKRKKLTPKERMAVWYTYIGERIHEHKCLCCKKATISQSKFEAGHVRSHVNGGDISIDNLRPICSDCNKAMKSMNMDKYIIKHKYWF